MSNPPKSIPCYRYLGHHRIDGRLTLRKDALHFEADFPSRHRLYLPLHQLLGLEYNRVASMIRTLSEFGTVSFYPIQEGSNKEEMDVHKDTALEFVRLVQQQFDPTRTPFFDAGNTTEEVVVDNNPLHSYLEGSYSCNDAPFTPCAIQIRQNSLHLLGRNTESQELHIETISALKCSRHWLGNTIETTFKSGSNTFRFRGTHSIQFWSILHCLSPKDTAIQSTLLHSWNDKRYWWQSPCTVVVLQNGLRWYSINLFGLSGNNEHLPWSSIQTLDFSGRTLSVQTDSGMVLLGRRHNTTFYKNLVEHILESMCHDFESQLVGLWDDERKVHMGTLSIKDDTLRFSPRNSSLSDIEYNLNDLWMPELFDSSKAFIQLRVPSSDPTPQWIVIHCGNPSIAQNWVSVLNLPSKRIPWTQLTESERTELFKNRPTTLQHPNHFITPVILKYINNTLAVTSVDEEVPVGATIELWFDNGQRKFRMHTEIEYKQDIPVSQWILKKPTQIDSYNFRAHHRTQVEFEAQLIPVKWDSSSGWLPDLSAALQVTIKDLSYTGCALELDNSLASSHLWLLQISLPSRTEQLMGQVRYQRQQTASNLWRAGFQFTTRRSQTIREMLSTISATEEPHVLD